MYDYKQNKCHYSQQRTTIVPVTGEVGDGEMGSEGGVDPREHHGFGWQLSRRVTAPTHADLIVADE